VQGLPSLQETPSAIAGLLQLPVVSSHVPTSWHWSSAVQTTEVPAWHTPAPSQVSAPLHALPSLQLVSAGLGVLLHAPAEQESTVHVLPSSQDG
jgi:hypothetical protein